MQGGYKPVELDGEVIARVPDRIILNLTEDPLHSIAVNWRTDASVESITAMSKPNSWIPY